MYFNRIIKDWDDATIFTQSYVIMMVSKPKGDTMKKLLMRVAIIGTMGMAGFTMTGCTDFERGFVSGAAVGVGTTVAAHESRNTRYSRSYYNRGYNDGCRSARGRWYKSSYYWRNFRSYRNGWNSGKRRCN